MDSGHGEGGPRDDSLRRRWGWGEDGHEGDDLALGREMWNNGQVGKKLSLGDWG
jgi:hypothetical protein